MKRATDPTELADRLKSYLDEFPLAAPSAESVRTAEFEGHQITVTTTYRITVDGKPFNAVLHVAHDGTVHSRGLPHAQFTSALDAAQALVATYPERAEGGA